MRKINAKQEKRERNKINALRFQKKESSAVKTLKTSGGKYGSWCRVMNHPSDCDVRYCEAAR